MAGRPRRSVRAPKKPRRGLSPPSLLSPPFWRRTAGGGHFFASSEAERSERASGPTTKAKYVEAAAAGDFDVAARHSAPRLHSTPHASSFCVVNFNLIAVKINTKQHEAGEAR